MKKIKKGKEEAVMEGRTHWELSVEQRHKPGKSTSHVAMYIHKGWGEGGTQNIADRDISKCKNPEAKTQELQRGQCDWK